MEERADNTRTRETGNLGDREAGNKAMHERGHRTREHNPDHRHTMNEDCANSLNTGEDFANSTAQKSELVHSTWENDEIMEDGGDPVPPDGQSDSFNPRDLRKRRTKKEEGDRGQGAGQDTATACVSERMTTGQDEAWRRGSDKKNAAQNHDEKDSVARTRGE